MSTTQATAPPSMEARVVSHLRTVPVSAIVPIDGRNPRMAFDDGELRVVGQHPGGSSTIPRKNSWPSLSRTLAVSFLGLEERVTSVLYLAGWAETAPPETFARIAELVDRLARRLEETLGDEEQPAADTRSLNYRTTPQIAY